MHLIGEKLNSSIPKTLEAMQSWDEKTLIGLIRSQADGGADFLDINTALTGDELPLMRRLVELVCTHSSCGIMLDSPSPEVLCAVLEQIDGREVMINSITLDDRFTSLCRLAAEKGASIVCLPMEGRAIPAPAERLAAGGKLIKKLTSLGVPEERIYIDVLIEALATDQQAARAALETIRLIKDAYPSVQTICGLSNISFGLPGRIGLNSAFLAMAMHAGLDSAILDPTSKTMRHALAASNALLGQDEFCMDYITVLREEID